MKQFACILLLAAGFWGLDAQAQDDTSAYQRNFDFAKEALDSTRNPLEVSESLLKAVEQLKDYTGADKPQLLKAVADLAAEGYKRVSSLRDDDRTKAQIRRAYRAVLQASGGTPPAANEPGDTIEGVVVTDDNEGALYSFHEALESVREERKQDPDSFTIPDRLKDAEGAIGEQEATKTFLPEALEQLKKILETERATTKDARVEKRASTVETALQEIDEMMTGKKEMAYGGVESLSQQIDQMQADLTSLVQDLGLAAEDARIHKISERIEAAKTKVAAQAKDLERDEIVNPAIEAWKQAQEYYAADAQGWEDEKEPPSYEEFLSHSPISLKLDKTYKYYELSDRWFDYDSVKAALEKYKDDPRLQKTLAEVTKVRDTAGGKLLAFSGKMLDALEKAGPKDQWNNSSYALEELTRVLENYAKGVAGQEQMLARVKNLAKKWEDEQNSEGAAKAALEEAMKKAALEVWPTFVQKYPKFDTIDPAVCQKDITPCKGKLLRFTGAPDRLGWDWYTDEYNWLTPMNGVPIVGKFDKGLDEALHAMEQASGIQWSDATEVMDVIGVVETICKVDRRDFLPITKEDYRAETVSAPCLRIVAIQAPPFALAVGQGTNLAKIPNMPAIEVKEAGVMR